jgi:uncharacterized protein (DUF952 family)
MKVEFIYKLVGSAPGLPVTEQGKLPENFVLPASDLDKRSGFMHLSTAVQVPGTLQFFPSPKSENGKLFILRAPLEPLVKNGDVRWESPDGQISDTPGKEGYFPHIYDDKKYRFTTDMIDSVVEIASEEGEEGFGKAVTKLGEDGWLK